jgi:hypothetical protein
VLLAVFGGLPLVMVLAAPAVAARIVLSGAPNLAPFLSQWQWMMIGSPLVALGAVRFGLSGNGRLRGTSTVKRWLGTLTRTAFLLATVNVTAFLKLTDAASTDHVISDGMPIFGLAALAGVATLVAIALWDRRPEPVTLEEVRAAAAEADRALRRVTAENERVRRQAEQVQARVATLRARSANSPNHTNGQAKRTRHNRHQPRIDVDFQALRMFHRESYQCADTAHMAYQSAQSSLRTMSNVTRRIRLAPRAWVPTGRAAKLARAEMRATATRLAASEGILRTRVNQGLGMVQNLNANTSELKHEIRDKCGARGQQWFEDLEQRIALARAERRAG